MKNLIYTACVGTLAVALTAHAADNDGVSHKKSRQNASTTQAASVRTTNSGQANVRHMGNGARFQQRSSFNATHNNSAVVHQNRFRSNNNLSVSHRQDFANARVRRHATMNNNAGVSTSSNLRVNRERQFNRTGRNFRTNNERNVTVNRQRNIQRNVTVNRQRNVVVTNNWRGDRFQGQQYVAFRNYHRQWHDRNWWSHNHTNIVFVFGGAYYWNSGYWYPCWGYNPGYNYIYDGPIYGYNHLAPDQVVVNVQSQLQRDGYYSGPVDGELGPMTRQAIADFQADHGLAVTSAVDEPTLSSLGLV